MMEKSWLTGLIGLFMVAFGIFGIWAIAEPGRIFADAPDLLAQLSTYGLFGMVVVMGVWSLAIAVERWGDGHAFIPGFLLAYRDALRRIRSQKWLLALAGYVVSVNILSALTALALDRYYLGGYAEKLSWSRGLPGSMMNGHGLPPIPILLESLSISARGALYYFLPDPGLSAYSAATGFLALSILCLLPWISRRLFSLQGQSDQTPAIRFFRRLVAPIGIAALLIAFGQFPLLWRQYSRLAASFGSESHTPTGISPIDWLNMTTVLLSTFFRVAIVTPLFVGGLAGSLRRASSGDPVNADSFLEDSIRAFRPIAGIFTLFLLIQTLSQIPLLMAWGTPMMGPTGQGVTYWNWFRLVWQPLMVIFMFAPYAVSAGANSMWRGLRESIGVWLNCGYNLLSFTAFGVASLTFTLTLSTMSSRFAGMPLSTLSHIPSLIATVIRGVVSIVMAVAVWEIHQQIRAAADEPEEAVSSVATEPTDPLDG